jgi:hypothetical protein
MKRFRLVGIDFSLHGKSRKKPSADLENHSFVLETSANLSGSFRMDLILFTSNGPVCQRIFAEDEG